MNTYIKIAIGAAVVIGVALGIFFYSVTSSMTSGMADAANAFFTNIKNNDYDRAYGSLAQEFRISTQQSSFEKYITQSGLNRYKEAAWSSWSVKSGRGELDGSVKTENGGTVPLTLKFVKENDEWKIFAIHKPRAGLLDQDSTIPNESELIDLTNESMLKFAQAVTAKDFTDFHAHVSTLWQKQFTVQKFEEVFKVFLDKNIDMVAAVQGNQPSFDPEPAMEGAILIVRGRYPTRPSEIRFQLKYLKEGLSWKLVGTKVDIVRAGT